MPRAVDVMFEDMVGCSLYVFPSFSVVDTICSLD